MKAIALAHLLVAFAASPIQAADQCPIFAKGAELTYQQTHGPDFAVCYAVDKGKNQLVGLYTGHAASYERRGRIKAERSSVAGIPAQWVLGKASDRPALYRETLINVRAMHGPDYEAHIWINAKDKEHLSLALAALSSMTFRY